MPTPSAIGMVEHAMAEAQKMGKNPMLVLASVIDKDRMQVFDQLQIHMEALMKNQKYRHLSGVHGALNHSFTVLIRALQRHWGVHEEIKTEEEDGDGDAPELSLG